MAAAKPAKPGNWVRRSMKLRYTGPYSREQYAGLVYPTGTAVTVHRTQGTVTVRLDTKQELYADWPLEHVERFVHG